MRTSFASMAMAMLTLAAGCAGSAPLAAPRVESGAVAQAKYKIAAPAKWNGDLLLLAHGYRQGGEPSAEFDANSPLYGELVRDGWIVASTSYRRNGVIIRDACEDIEALRAHVAGQFGRPRRVFLLGWSMGGAIGAMLAETRGGDYAGVMLVGAALDMRDDVNFYILTHQPKAPILFLTNQSELAHPAEYARKVTPPSPLPASWILKRDGHCNVRDVETRAALFALVRWAESGQVLRERDGTIPAGNVPSVAAFRDGRAYAKVTKVTTPGGNIHTPFVQADLDRLGIKPRTRLVVGKGEKHFEVFLGTVYGDVPQGQWIAFMTADGWLQIARNWANAAQELGCQRGDEIYIAPQTPEKH